MVGGLVGQGKDSEEEKEDGAVLEEVLREAGIDWTEVERLTRDRKGWKKGGGENGAFGQVGKAEGAWV